MKKVFSLALVAGVFAFASCESKPAESAEGAATEATTDSTAVEAAPADTAAATADTTAAVADTAATTAE